MEINFTIWILFICFILFMLLLDLGLFSRKDEIISTKKALLWSLFWITLAMLFNYGIYHFLGKAKALEFLTGYIIEKSLSVDNLFVFIMVFGYFGIDGKYQHKILFWGIMGALIMRAIFIFTGVALINQFHWIIYVFGTFLIYTGFKMLVEKADNTRNPENKIITGLIQRFIPLTDQFHQGKFFLKINRKLHITQLFIVLVIIEFTDLIFAVDSIPAILAISNDTFIIFTSNVFAILGLRSLYFALVNIVGAFHLLKYGLAVILMFIGIKMSISSFFKIPITTSLYTIGAAIALSVILSLILKKKNHS